MSVKMNIFNSGLCRSLHQFHNYFNKFHQARLLNSCVACNFQSFSFQRTFQTSDPLLQTNSLAFSQKLSPKYFSSQFCFIKRQSESYSTYRLSCVELPLRDQIRTLHSYNRGKRRSKALLSRTNSSTSREQSENEPKKPGESEEKDSKDDSEKSLTLYQRFKKTYKEHGKVLVVVHLLTSAVWYGSFYTAARLGVDIVPLLESWNLNEKMISPFRSGGLGDFALAYLMYKLATPARYTVTIGGTNLAIRYLRKGGKMPPVRKEDSLRQLYKEGKADLRTKSTNTKRNIRRMHTRIQGRIRRGRRRS